MVITDGSPDDGQAVEREIIDCTKRLRDDDEMSVSFIQIGEDPGAKKYLKNLDNSLEAKGARFDIGTNPVCFKLLLSQLTLKLVNR